jgi:hypothetical protein
VTIDWRYAASGISKRDMIVVQEQKIECVGCRGRKVSKVVEIGNTRLRKKEEHRRCL